MSMEPWVFEDGTRVWLGGRVEGDAPVATTARAVFALVRSGEFIGSGFGREPDTEPLELDSPHLLDSWLRMRSSPIVSAPRVEYPALDATAEPPSGLY